MTLSLDRRGWLVPYPGIVLAPSPNADDRPADTQISLLVVHNISLPPGEFGGSYITTLFQNRIRETDHPWFVNLRDLKVSAHFLVRRDGSVVQYVSTDRRAWHAGVSRFNSRERCNDFSIGIEVEGTDTQPYDDRQYATVARLSNVLAHRYPLIAVRGHEDIAPGRKTDPGPTFEWRRLATSGAWPLRALPRR
ncbi:MAG: 1,6-anhydro-N-acetylmuramyl-L-alanine amidase AmpD [Burkholderiaceae bacterium]|nr:1,6-anhydro-N-acetylmuramyl-L-alanine amidase AmpD [Burkholderiaceae bacterium]